MVLLQHLFPIRPALPGSCDVTFPRFRRPSPALRRCPSGSRSRKRSRALRTYRPSFGVTLPASARTEMRRRSPQGQAAI